MTLRINLTIVRCGELSTLAEIDALAQSGAGIAAAKSSVLAESRRLSITCREATWQRGACRRQVRYRGRTPTQNQG
jgi:hypothetical protein